MAQPFEPIVVRLFRIRIGSRTLAKTQFGRGLGHHHGAPGRVDTRHYRCFTGQPSRFQRQHYPITASLVQDSTARFPYVWAPSVSSGHDQRREKASKSHQRHTAPKRRADGVERVRIMGGKMRERLSGLAVHENIYNIPNILTASRLLLTPVIGYLVLHDSHAWAVGLFAYAGISDLVDGWMARKWKLQTVVGSVIDPMADKFLMAVLVGCLAVKGAIPCAYLSPPPSSPRSLSRVPPTLRVLSRLQLPLGSILQEARNSDISIHRCSVQYGSPR